MTQLALALDAAIGAPLPASPVDVLTGTSAAPADPYALLGRDAGPVRFAFDCMDTADEAIDGACASCPERAGLLSRAFLTLRPRPELFAGLSPALIRGHMDELLRRIAADGPAADLAPGTAAEVCVAMSRLSNAAPLRHEAYVVYLVAFIDAMGRDQAAELVGEEPVRRAVEDRDTHWPAEIYREVQHRMRDEGRARGWKAVLAREAAA